MYRHLLNGCSARKLTKEFWSKGWNKLSVVGCWKDYKMPISWTSSSLRLVQVCHILLLSNAMKIIYTKFYFNGCQEMWIYGNVVMDTYHYHHHHVHAPSWSVAVSTGCFQCSRSWAYFHAELRPKLWGWRSASRVHSQVWRGHPGGGLQSLGIDTYAWNKVWWWN